MSKIKTVKYVSTIGLKVYSPKLNRSYLAKVFFAIQSDEKTVFAHVENAHNGNRLNFFGRLTLTRDELREMPADPYNNLIFAEAAFDLFDLQICGRNTDKDQA